MPTHERLRITGDPLDLVPENRKVGLAGVMVGPILGTGVGSSDAPLGTNPAIAAPTAVSAADPVLRSGEVDVAFTAPAGATGVEVITRVHATGAFVKKQDKLAGASPCAVTGLNNGTQHRFDVRGYKADGSVGLYADAVTATPTA